MRGRHLKQDFREVTKSSICRYLEEEGSRGGNSKCKGPESGVCWAHCKEAI